MGYQPKMRVWTITKHPTDSDGNIPLIPDLGMMELVARFQPDQGMLNFGASYFFRQHINESSRETLHMFHTPHFSDTFFRFWNDALKVAFSSAVFRGRLKHPQSAAWQLWDTLGNFKSSLIYSSSPMIDLLWFLYPIINLSIACWAWHQLTHWLHPGWKITSNQQVKHRNVWWYFIAIVVHQSVFV